jgi:hypothetical protein
MNNTHVIESNVPPPEAKRSRSIPLYPWPQMKVGDSFTVEGRISAAAARGSFARYQKIGKIPADWKCVQWTEENGVVRFWAMLEGDSK